MLVDSAEAEESGGLEEGEEDGLGDCVGAVEGVVDCDGFG